MAAGKSNATQRNISRLVDPRVMAGAGCRMAATIHSGVRASIGSKIVRKSVRARKPNAGAESNG